MELEVWFRWIGALLNLKSAKKEEHWIENSGGRFVITGMDCLQQCHHKHFEIVAFGRNYGFLC